MLSLAEIQQIVASIHPSIAWRTKCRKMNLAQLWTLLNTSWAVRKIQRLWRQSRVQGKHILNDVDPLTQESFEEMEGSTFDLHIDGCKYMRYNALQLFRYLHSAKVMREGW